jgi:hypothetical protein
MITDDIREVAKQAAREAVARRHDIDGWSSQAALIRIGELDDEPDVHDAILGALAALDAVAPLIVARSGG